MPETAASETDDEDDDEEDLEWLLPSDDESESDCKSDSESDFSSLASDSEPEDLNLLQDMSVQPLTNLCVPPAPQQREFSTGI